MAGCWPSVLTAVGLTQALEQVWQSTPAVLVPGCVQEEQIPSSSQLHTEVKANLAPSTKVKVKFKRTWYFPALSTSEGPSNVLAMKSASTPGAACKYRSPFKTCTPHKSIRGETRQTPGLHTMLLTRKNQTLPWPFLNKLYLQ